MQITIQWGKKVFSQPPIVQVLPLKNMREACNIHHRYTSTMADKIPATVCENLGEDLQKTFDLCHCQQRVYNKVLR